MQYKQKIFYPLVIETRKTTVWKGIESLSQTLIF